jgi:ribulose-5-phosphate 4-epimerase/fuculose-1-phosphate aldolase
MTNDTPTDRDLEAIADFWHPSHGWCVRGDTYAAALASAEAAEKLAAAAAVLLNRDTETGGNAEQPYYDNVSAALAAFRAALRNGEDTI